MVDAVGNTSNSVTRHANNEEIKQGITTFADGKHAVVYDGKTDLSVFLAKCNNGKKYTQQEINNFLINADRQDDDIEYNGSRTDKLNAQLQAGDVIILDNNNVKSVNEYKQQLASEEKEKAKNDAIKAQEEKLAKMKKNNWSVGIGVAGAIATAGLAFVGWPWALGAAAVTGVTYLVRWRHNTVQEEKAKLEELTNQE